MLTPEDWMAIQEFVAAEVKKAMATEQVKAKPLSGYERLKQHRARKKQEMITKTLSNVINDNENVIKKVITKTSPKKKESNSPDTRETWKSYMDAYFNRYSVEPVRNATVNSQMVRFCHRVPLDEAPHIAAFYLTHRSSFYTQKMHPVGLLLADAEKLRTEWATNRQMTATAAMQADKQSTTGDAVESAIRMMRERDAKRATDK